MFNLNVKSGCYNGATWLDEFKCENLVTPSGMERCFAIHFFYFFLCKLISMYSQT